MRDGAVDDKEVARDFLTKIDDEVNRLTQLVAELTELSRIETGDAQLELGPVDLNALLEEIITQLAPQAARSQLTVRHEPARPRSAEALCTDARRSTSSPAPAVVPTT